MAQFDEEIPAFPGEEVESLPLLNRLAQIGISLSAERNMPALLEKIADEALSFTNADGVTFYLLEDNHLHFSVSVNLSLNTRTGGVTGTPTDFPPLPLDDSFVSAYAAIHKETVNVHDVYRSTGFDFTGPKKFDEKTGYRSVSQLAVPLKNNQDDVIGVLQLLNAIDPETKNIIPFDERATILAESLASQASVALSNFYLVKETEHLFESFLKVMAAGLDARSKYTHGHVRRVAGLTMELARAVNATTEGALADKHFSKADINELWIAGWMHDIGKIVSPPHIMDKSVKLETIFDRASLIATRYEFMKASERKSFAERKLALGQNSANSETLGRLELEEQKIIEELDSEKEFLLACNHPGEFMDDDKIERLSLIAGKTYVIEGKTCNRLSADELKNLSIRRGSLTDEERKIMQDHIVVTVRMLDNMSFPKKYKNAALYAGSHHECLDGSGYPKGLIGEEMPLQSRILAVSDFLEALMASDRPYKKPMPLEKALAILKNEVEKGKIDGDLIDLIEKEEVFQKFLERDKAGEFKVNF